MSKSNNPNGNRHLDSTWRLLMFLLSLLVCLIILCSSYLVLSQQIHQYLNRKVYTKEELKGFSQRAALRTAENNYDKIENGIHLRTGLKADKHLETIIASCTSCHSAKLITQNKATREGWTSMIRWMQETQGLPELGTNEVAILDYLSRHYAPENTGRRKNLDIEKIEWYVLKETSK